LISQKNIFFISGQQSSLIFFCSRLSDKGLILFEIKSK
jgi:hypothetical protein